MSERNGTLVQVDMFDTVVNNTLLTGLPRPNDLKVFHPLKYPTTGNLNTDFIELLCMQRYEC